MSRASKTLQDGHFPPLLLYNFNTLIAKFRNLGIHINKNVFEVSVCVFILELRSILGDFSFKK